MGESFLKRLNKLNRVRPEFYRQARFGEVEEALQRLIADASDADQRNNARAALSSHYQFKGNNVAALKVINEQINEKPDDVQALIALTEHHHYAQVDLVKAADAVERALAFATIQALLVRQVLGVRMRIALESGNFDVASDSLVRLVEYMPPAHSLDVAYERDFLEMIPPGAIDSTLIKRYSALVPVA